MSATLTTLSVRSDRPVDNLTVAVLRDVDRVALELSLPYFVAGAMARDILLTHVSGLDIRRATLDVDFAVAVENWEQFQSIKARLAQGGRYQPAEKIEQRLYYLLPGGRKGYPVDIIPFGGVEQPANTIKWPPDMKVMMNVVGYQEALDNSVEVEVEAGLVIRVASLPGLALLKLFTWVDRGNENSKDALDLVILFRSYYEAGNQDRLYGEEIGMLEAVNFNLDLASPRLLGKDVRSIATPAIQERTMALLSDSRVTDRLITHMAQGLRHADDSVVEAERLLDQFKAGLTES